MDYCANAVLTDIKEEISSDVEETVVSLPTHDPRYTKLHRTKFKTENCANTVQVDVKEEILSDLEETIESDDPLGFTTLKTIKTEDIVTSTTSTARTGAQRQRAYRQRQAASRNPEQVRAFLKAAAEKRREYRQRQALTRTPAVPFVVPHATSTAKTNAQRQRDYRARQAALRTPEQSRAFLTKTAAERQRTRKLRKSGKTPLSSGTSESPAFTVERTSVNASTQTDVQPNTYSSKTNEQSTWYTKWSSSIKRFQSTFLDNDFGHACSICDRLWFKNDLKTITALQLKVISDWYVKENRQLRKEDYTKSCNTCRLSLKMRKFPTLAKVNGFSYPDVPPGLPPLDPITERLVSPCLPFMQVRRLRRDVSSEMIGQVINVPVNVPDMAKCLPRRLEEDDVINVNIERNLAHKTNYISGNISKRTVKEWLDVLENSSLYRLYDIKIDLSRLQSDDEGLQDDPANRIEAISAAEVVAARQHTLLWNEEDCPDSIFDRHVEELSFPAIYLGEPRRFNISVTPYMMAASEIRRSDRRGATAQKVLYDAIKILRLRIADGIYPEFLQNRTEEDLFAMLRQLGKPTVFLTLSANEVRWLVLLNLLLKLSNKYPGKVAEDLNISERCSLVSDDPITCCIYFHKLVGTLMKMLKSKQSYNPFGQYYVQDYFLRIEFQHKASPQAHIFLWLHDDPHETVSENMPKTIELVEKLSSVAKEDVPDDTNQIHKHTFNCSKQGETTTCRFGIPYWPMLTTRVLIPMPQTDGLQKKAQELRDCLSERTYANMDDFLREHSLTFDAYLDVVRSTLRRPSLLFKRNFDQLLTDTFNPYLVGEIKSNVDIEFILDEDSCAQYIVEYMSKSARGMGSLSRELTKMMQEHPDRDYTGRLKALSAKLVNAVEMSAQEAAWFLLRQPMSETSRKIMYIPTVWPSERQRCRKRRKQMDRENIEADSTDLWTTNIIQRYEERPASLESLYLAEFASYYADNHDSIDNEEDEIEQQATTLEKTTSKKHHRRKIGRIIRYRRYEIDETVNYQREMVLLFLPFRNEMADIVDNNKFLQLFNDNRDTIMKRRQLFENNLNMESVIQELEVNKKSAKISEKTFRCGNSFRIHEKIHTGEKPFICEICGKKFPDRKNLGIHTRFHTGEKPYACKICEKTFRYVNSLRIHKKIHTSEKPFICEFCGKKVRDHTSLRIHIRVHTGEKPYACKICEKTFARSHSLRVHERIHTGEKPFSCKICDKKFTTRALLYNHMRVHTREKPYTCKICEKTFGSSYCLKMHERIHTGERPFSCGFCGKGCTQRGNLRSHLMRQHKNEALTCSICEKSSKRVHARNFLIKHNGEKPYICEICQPEENNLNLFFCEICKRQFSRKPSIRRHMLTHFQTK